MTSSNFPRARLACVAGAASLLLAACGGGGDDAAITGSPATPATSAPTTPVVTTPTSPVTPVTTPPAAVALAPLAGGSTYTGTASFGDTIAVVLDETARTVTLRFVDSRFGLAGSISSAYTADSASGGFVAKAFTGAGTAFTAAQLAAVNLRFSVQDGLITGALQQVANLRQGKGALLQGQVSASNRGVASLSALAGTYSFLRERATYGSDGAVTQAAAPAYGQIGIKADGSLRICFSQAYSDTCTNTEGTQQVATTGTLAAEADQARYPGAMALAIGGQTVGRVMAGSRSGQTTLLVDEFQGGATGGFTTGTWLLQPATALAATALDGEWLCSEPEVSAANAPTGRMLRHYVSVGQSTLQTDTVDTDITLDTRAGGVGGLVTGQWKDSNASAPARIFVPLAGGTVRYVGTASAAKGAASVSGTCQALPAQATVTTYLAAEAGKVSLVAIGDARPTQPAIGYDQVYYKQGRYRHVATGATASTVWQKAFDDLCEDSGQTAATTSAKLTTKTDVTTWKLNDRSTFDCSVTPANRTTTGLKTAVVGPKGQLFLTDGHHTFTSLYEAPNNQGKGATAGGSVQMPVVIQANDKDLSNAAFWRKMRASKYVWLKDPTGQAITPADLPAQIGLSNGLTDDPYRALVYYTRDVGYAPPANAPEYLEFYWGDWLKAAPQNIDLTRYDLTTAGAGNGTDKGYMQAIRDASTLMVGAAPSTVIGSDPAYTALTMGARTGNFGTSDFTDLSTPKPANGKKAGKLAYALEYRAWLAATK